MADDFLGAPPRSSLGGTFSATMWVLGTIAGFQILAVAWAVITRPGLEPSSEGAASLAVTEPTGQAAIPDPVIPPTVDVEPEITDPNELFTDPETAVDITTMPDPTLPAATSPDQLTAGIPDGLAWGDLLKEAGITGPENLGGISGAQPLSDSLDQAAMQTHPAHEISDPAILEMIGRGSEMQSTGDMNGALKAYREALEVLPSHPRILSEMAAAYDKMGRADKAAELWERIYRLGSESAGSYFLIADQQLRGQGIELADLDANSNILKITSVVPSRDPGSTDGERVNLRVTIGADPATRPAGPDMKMHVYFYDFVDGNDFEPSTANTDERYPTEPYDWSAGMEMIDVSYHQPIFTDVQQRELGERSYFGYIIELYYRDELQDRVSSPEELAEIVPGEKTEITQPVFGPDSSLFPQSSNNAD